MVLESLKMEQLRSLGYELEKIVDHEVRGNSSKALVTEIVDAMAELDAEELELFADVAKADLGIDLGINLSSEENDSPNNKQLDPDEVEAKRLEQERLEQQEHEEEGGEDIYVQIRAIPLESGLFNNELLKNPKQELLSKYSYATLTHEQFIDLKAAGYRHNEDPRFSGK